MTRWYCVPGIRNARRPYTRVVTGKATNDRAAKGFFARDVDEKSQRKDSRRLDRDHR